MTQFNCLNMLEFPYCFVNIINILQILQGVNMTTCPKLTFMKYTVKLLISLDNIVVSCQNISQWGFTDLTCYPTAITNTEISAKINYQNNVSAIYLKQIYCKHPVLGKIHICVSVFLSQFCFLFKWMRFTHLGWWERR